jgi:hypothetical protein
MLTYKVYFRVALFPEGVKDLRFEDDIYKNDKFIEANKVYNKHLCTEQQSAFILNELTSVYSMLNEINVTNLTYEGTGNFNCKVTLKNNESLYDAKTDELDRYICEMLWPANIHEPAIMFINGEKLYFQLEVDYITDWLEEDANVEEDKITQYTYNGVYYADSIEMEHQMRQDNILHKVREKLAKNTCQPSEK